MDIAAQLYQIKEFIIAGVSSLPRILGGISLLLACSTANTGFAILAVCLALIVPFLTYILNISSPVIIKIIQFIASQFGDIPEFPGQAAGVCRIAPSSEVGMAASFPSYWMASIVFFFTFVFMNGLSLYNFAANQVAADDKVSSRKTHAIIGMAASIILGLLLLVWRYRTGCENGLGLFMSLSFIGLGYGLFTLFDSCGLLRVVDLYGIGARLLPTSATAAPTQVCFPVGSNT
jgi:hypothetical protein